MLLHLSVVHFFLFLSNVPRTSHILTGSVFVLSPLWILLLLAVTVALHVVQVVLFYFLSFLLSSARLATLLCISIIFAMDCQVYI